MARYKNSKLLLLFLALWANYGYSQNYPERPEPAVYVNDLAGLFSKTQKAELENLLINYYDSTSTQIVVLNIKSLEGMNASQYAIEIAEKWGIGQADKDNGVLFLVAPNERKMFIAAGRGTEERLTDVFLGRIRDNYILPEFKRGNYYSGIRLGILQMMNRLSGKFVNDIEDSEEISLSTLILILILILFFFWIMGKFSKRMNYSETYSGRGYRDSWGSGWTSGTGWSSGGSSWGGGSSGGFGGGSFGGGSFGGGGAGGSW